MAEVSDLAAHTGYLLRMVSNAVSQEFARKVAGEDVTVAEWAVLRTLYGSQPMAPSALALTMGMTRGRDPLMTDRSEWQRPAACTRTSSSPGPGGARSSSTISRGRDCA